MDDSGDEMVHEEVTEEDLQENKRAISDALAKLDQDRTSRLEYLFVEGGSFICFVYSCVCRLYGIS